MTIETIVGSGGLFLIAAAMIKAALSAVSFARHRSRVARQTQQQLDWFRSEATAIYEQLHPMVKRQQFSWQGKRKFRIVSRVVEDLNGDICSFYLLPIDGAPLPKYRPGQFLTFEIAIPGLNEPVTRCYSLSELPTQPQNAYRITIKKLAPPQGKSKDVPPGLVSNFFHDRLGETDVVDVIAPAGSFYLNTASDRPVVLVAGGVGLTPLISMLNWLVATHSRREIWFFYGLRNRFQHAFYEHLKMLSRTQNNLRMLVCYSQPSSKCRRGIDYDVNGVVNIDLLQHLLPTRDCEFYLCGPDPMMQSLTKGLRQWGVSDDDIMSEHFAPPGTEGAGVSETQWVEQPSPARADSSEEFNIEFARSGKRVTWMKHHGTLLELADACGVVANSSCRAGQCGSCQVQLHQGTVEYLRDPEAFVSAGSCLPCITRPATDLVLDL